MTAQIFTPLPKAEQDARAIEREQRTDAGNLAVLCSARDRVRSSIRYGKERALTDAEARHYAFAAMAALNHEEVSDYLGGKRLVGPYVTEAVRHVLRDVDHSPSDSAVVESMACAINVALRFSGPCPECGVEGGEHHHRCPER